jgi:DNA polymerase III epsilon subunit-like protein
LRYVVLDTELTSLDSRTNRLLSVGAVAMQGTSIRFGEQFYRVANPGVDVPAESIVIHGLRPSDVAEGEKPGDVLNELRDFLGDSVVVGHFVGIDTKILRKELRGSESSPLDNPVLDTARAHHWLAQHGLRLRGLEDSRDSLSLASLAKEYGIEMKDAHHALYDAFLTAQLWQQLVPRLVGAGVDTLGKALRIAGG